MSNPATPTTHVTYESCAAFLTSGKQVADLSPECQKILGQARGVLTRRDSGAWNSKSGHDVRQAPPSAAMYDEVKKENELSISEIYLKNKSPEDQKVIKQKIARTASRGGKVRTDDIVSVEDVEKERAKFAQERIVQKEAHPKI
ncbi:hypothetical protein BASA81_004088 [Batrachochytrium salamandrivorans]|nr:hypothetical protein BASA81_004088 [Batrachochytrium salamandrivorans]